jgi:hypothetical protein
MSCSRDVMNMKCCGDVEGPSEHEEMTEARRGGDKRVRARFSSKELGEADKGSIERLCWPQ